MNKFNNQSGFSAIQTLLTVFVIAIISFTGWYVWSAKHDTDNNLKQTSNGNQSSPSHKYTSKPVASDPYANWHDYSSASGKFSLKYPAEWATAQNSTECSDGILLLGANGDSVGECNSNNFGQVTVTWQPKRTDCGFTGAYWTTTSSQNVTVTGVDGLQTNATAKEGASVPAGTKTEQYCFIRSGQMFVASYSQLSSYPDVLSQFNSMIKNTLRFN